MTAFEVMEQAGWSADDWNQLDADIRAVVKATARVRGILPVGPPSPNAYQVFVPTITGSADGFFMDTSVSVLPVRLSCRLLIRSEQVGDRAIVGALAKRAAHALAGVEDQVLAFGGGLLPAPPAAAPAPARPAGRAAAAAPAPAPAPAPLSISGVEITPLTASTQGLSPPTPAVRRGPKRVLELVSDAIAKLQSVGHFGPYSALLLPKLWNDAALELAALSLSTRKAVEASLGDQGELIPLQTIGAANDKRGIVISTGSGGYDIVQVAPPSITLDGYKAGDLLLRVEERFVLRVLDDTAAVNIED